jgi:acyl-CoA thioester hydrolase
VRNSARIVCSEKLELHILKRQTGICMMLVSGSCRYKFPLTYAGPITVGTKITIMADDRFTLKFTLVNRKHQKVTAESGSVIVIFNDTEGKKTISLRRPGRKSLPGTGCLWKKRGA